MVDTVEGYTQAVKDYKLEGQNVDMWTQFLTGTQEKFKTLGEQATSAYETGVTEAQQASAYDISQAYSNYKKQQLSLQMQEQLGAGFKQQLGSELKSAYDITYSGLEKQRESALSKLQSEYVSSLTELGEEYETAVKKGESEFSKLGETVKSFDKYVHDFAEFTGKTFDEGHYKKYTDDEGNVVTELTNLGKTWYADLLNDERFEDWLLQGDGNLSETELKKREDIYNKYIENRNMIKQIIAGIGEDFDYEKIKSASVQERGVTDTIATVYGWNVDEKTLKAVKETQARNPEAIATATNITYKNNTKIKDDSGREWYFSDNFTEAEEISKEELDEGVYKKGDIIYRNGLTYIVKEVGPRIITKRSKAPNTPGIKIVPIYKDW